MQRNLGWLYGWVVCWGLGGCSANLDVPGNATLECAAVSECPSGWVCNVPTGRCIPVGQNTQPTLTFAPIARELSGSVSIDVSIFDPERSEVRIESVSILQDSGSVVATISDPVLPTSYTPDGSTLSTDATLTWDAEGDLGTGATTNLRLRASYTDLDSNRTFDAEMGPAEAFIYGNDPPLLQNVSIEGTTGNVVVRFEVADSTSDLAAVLDTGLGTTPEYSLDGGPFQPIPPEAIVGGLTDTLTTLPAPSFNSVNFTWNTRETVGGTAQLDIASGSGSIIVRLTPSDSTVGVSVSSAAQLLDNNSAPIVTLVEPALGQDRIGDINVAVRIIDADSDPVDLEVQWSDTSAFPALPAQLVEFPIRNVHGRTEGTSTMTTVAAPSFVSELPPTTRGEHPLEGALLEVLQPPAERSLGLGGRTSTGGALLEPGDSALLVADPSAGVVVRVQLLDGSEATVATLPQVSSLAATSDPDVVLATTGDGLYEIALSTGNTNQVAAGLVDPRGVVAVSPVRALVLESTGDLSFIELDGVMAPPRTNVALLWPTGLTTPRGLVADPTGHDVYISGDGDIVRLDLRTLRSFPVLGGASNPGALAVASDGATLYAVMESLQQLWALNPRIPETGTRVVRFFLNTATAVASGASGANVYVVESVAPNVVDVQLRPTVLESATISSVSNSALVLATPLNAVPAPGTLFRVVRGGPMDTQGLASSPTGVEHRFTVRIPEPLNSPQSVFLSVTPSDGSAGLAATSTVGLSLTNDYSPRVVRDIPIASVPNVGGLEVGDIDGDGDDDMVVSVVSDDKLVVYEQDSPGVFSSAITELTDGVNLDGPIAVEIADLNQDGLLDVATAGITSGSINVFIQGGAVVRIATGSLPVSLASGDMDNDGDMDLVVTSFDDQIEIYEQTSAGVFASSPELVMDALLMNPEAVMVGQLNGDHLLDIVAFASGGTSLFVFFQDIAGGFTSPTVLPLQGFTEEESLVVADIDGDGDDDLAASDFSGTVSVFFQDASSVGGFEANPLLLPDPILALPGGMAAGDMDGNGLIDLVTVGRAGTVTLFYQMMPRVFRSSTLSSGVSSGMGAPVLSDIDGDGVLDLAIANRGDVPRVTVFQRQAPTGFSAVEILSPQTLSLTPVGMDAGDVDGDGFLDMILGGQGTIELFSQSGPTAFSPSLVLSEMLGAVQEVRARDVDGDGRLDILFGNDTCGGGVIGIFFQGSDGTFDASPVILQTGPSAGSVVSADFDGDGVLDVATTGDAGESLALYVQNPSQLRMFTAVPGFPTTGPIKLIASDVDSDGDVDVVSRTNSGDVEVYLQDVSGLSTTPISRSPFGALRDFVVADTDDNGLADIVVVGPVDVEVFYQTTPGVFDMSSTAVAVVPNLSNAVTAGDFDGDGDIDIAVSSSISTLDEIWLLLQDNTGGYPDTPAILSHPAVLAPDGLLARDINHDGRMDLVVGHSGGATVFYKD